MGKCPLERKNDIDGLSPERQALMDKRWNKLEEFAVMVRGGLATGFGVGGHGYGKEEMLNTGWLGIDRYQDRYEINEYGLRGYDILCRSRDNKRMA